MPRHKRILGGIWGSLIGDALGVPVEFKDRAEVQADPVTDMRGFGSHNQPAGTWSDDSSLLLCSADSLIRHEFDTEDMGKRFLAWYREELWTPHGRVFDVGVTTSRALSRISSGVPAEVAGGDDQYSNGNGSLMRILPVSLRFSGAPTKQFLDRVHRASAITHRHPRSLLACGLYSLVIRELLAGVDANTAVSQHYAISAPFTRPTHIGRSNWSIFNCCWPDAWATAPSRRLIRADTSHTRSPPAFAAF